MPDCLPKNSYQELLNVIDLAVAAQDVDEMQRAVLPELAGFFQLDSASFFVINSDRFVRPCDLNIDTSRRKDYMSYFYRFSPFRPSNPAIKHSGRDLFQIEDLVRRSVFEETRYFRDYFRFLGVFHEMGVYLRCEGKPIGFINLNRADRRRPFLRSELRAAEELAGRLARVLCLHLAREREQQELEVLQVSGEHLNCGILTLNRLFEPLYQNGRGRDLLARLEQETGTGNQASGLLEKIRQGLERLAGTGPFNLSIALSEQEKYLIQACKLGESGKPLQAPAYLVEIREMGSVWKQDAERLGQRYGLGAREVEIVRLIARGLSNKEIAGKLSISLWTVLTHVKNIFTKMRVHNRTSAVQKALDLISG